MSRTIKIAVACGIALLFVAARLLLHTWRIPQDGMYPSIPKDSTVFGRHVLQRPAANVRRGDVVVYDRVRDGKHYDFIWRVIGLPGETLEIRDDVVHIDGAPLRQDPVRVESDFEILREHAEKTSYLIALPRKRAGTTPSNHPPVQIPRDSIFLLGDNRHNAYDSRAEGTVQLEAIHGRVFQ